MYRRHTTQYVTQETSPRQNILLTQSKLPLGYGTPFRQLLACINQHLRTHLRESLYQSERLFQPKPVVREIGELFYGPPRRRGWRRLIGGRCLLMLALTVSLLTLLGNDIGRCGHHSKKRDSNTSNGLEK